MSSFASRIIGKGIHVAWGQVAANLPYLRRYARALTGSQQTGDAFVRATLEAALADEDLKQSLSAGRVPLYHVFNKVWSSAYLEVADDGAGNASRSRRRRAGPAADDHPAQSPGAAADHARGFLDRRSGRDHGIGAADVEALVQEAVDEIDRESTTSVLIIEDEPLISMQLEDLVRSLGHEVCGTAATRTQAQRSRRRADPRSGAGRHPARRRQSSGLDAVDDILAIGSVPVIFITAYPERLLTGDRPEPTYLVTKPFQESTVRAAISQALFFGSSRPLG